MMRQMLRDPQAATCIGSRFGRFGNEDEKAIARAAVTESQGFKAIVQAWQDYGYNFKLGLEQNYGNALAHAEAIDYDAKDVEQFSIALIGMADEHNWDSLGKRIGVFLSALMNSGKDDAYEVHTKELPEVQQLGYRNRKSITVRGDLGWYVGEHMECGSIIVKGHVHRGVIGTAMKGGDIVVEGDSGPFTGERMRGGSITIQGNSRGEIGEYMKDGRITVKGDVDGCRIGTCMAGGEIDIHGDVRDGVGSFMWGGAIIVRGDVRIDAGEGMQGGLIVIDGNAGDLVGRWMSGGKIIARDAGKDVGYGMDDGQIHVYGELGSVCVLGFFERLWAHIKQDHRRLNSDIRAGEVYHKGILIAGR